MTHSAYSVVGALHMSLAMFWEILWALILGFGFSAIVQAVVAKSEMGKLLGNARPRTLALACGLGAASSSCSYAAVAIARSIFRKGGDFTAAMAFEIASTNMVLELGIILIVLMGWRFAAAEFVGAIVMVILLALIFRVFLSKTLLASAHAQAEKGVAGKMEGHAGMDMSLSGGSLASRILSRDGFTAISHYFIMDWASLWLDIGVGLLIAGAVAVFVPADFWNGFFLSSHPVAARFWGPLIGPLVAVFTFVCSIGNIPLAAVLWNGGISFGGVIAFIYADLIVLPVLNIYRKYYGKRMMIFLFVTFYATMAGAALLTELLFEALGLIPTVRNARVIETAITWNYTSVLDILFLVIAAILFVRFLRTGGPAMLKMMEAPAPAEGASCHHDHHSHGHHHG
jgi:uncharacterized membrane protein YraQ (UPF0718 family)